MVKKAPNFFNTIHWDGKGGCALGTAVNALAYFCEAVGGRTPTLQVFTHALNSLGLAHPWKLMCTGDQPRHTDVAKEHVGK